MYTRDDAVWKGFYVIEGIDGAGKTACMELLKKRARLEGRSDIVFTHEPTRYGQGMIAAMEKDAPPCPETLAFAFAADRNEHLFGKDGIADCLSAGCKVICDRYLFSSLAYQGAAGAGRLAFRLNLQAGRFPYPELTVYLDIGVDEALRRIAARGKSSPLESRDILLRVWDRYEQMMDDVERFRLPLRILRVNACLPPEDIAAVVWRECMEE